MSGSFNQLIAQIEASGEQAALATVVRTQGSTPRREGSKMVVYPDGTFVGTIGGGEMESRVIAEAQTAMKRGKPTMLTYNFTDPERGDPGVCGGTMEVYVEPIQPNPQLILIGAGHVGRAVAHLANWLGYYLVVSDDRPDYATPEQVPNANEYHTLPVAELFEKVHLHHQTYVVLTTRNNGLDVDAIPTLLESKAAYIGVIGSKRRWETTKKKLKAAGVKVKEIDRIVSPIGLELNAETPEEIALSVMAEITMLRMGGSGKRMAGG